MSTTHELHLTDADVVRHLDREDDEAGRARTRHHLEGCAACAARVATFRGHSEAVGAWLRHADQPLPEWSGGVRGEGTGVAEALGEEARSEGVRGEADGSAPVEFPGAARLRRGRFSNVGASPWLRAAVIVLLVAAPLAALQPVREWVAEQVGLATPAAESATMSTAAAPAEADAIVRFVPAPGLFTVRAEAQAHGSVLVLGRSEGDEAVLRAMAGAAPVVSDDAIRIPAGDRPATYTLLLPAGVDAVRVIAGEAETRVDAATLGEGRTVALPGRP